MPPLNLVGDFGGGGMLLAFGIVCGILEASRSGTGQVVDAAMVDGAALLAGMMHGLRASGDWGERGAPTCSTPEPGSTRCTRRRTAATSPRPIDERSCRELVRRIGLADDVDGGGPSPTSSDRATWPAMKERLAAAVRTRTRDEWCALLEGTDACFAPVLDPGEAPHHPHLARAGDVHGGRRCGPAGARAAVLAGPRRRSPARLRLLASTPTKRWPTGASVRPRSTPAPARLRAIADVSVENFSGACVSGRRIFLRESRRVCGK